MLLLKWTVLIPSMDFKRQLNPEFALARPDGRQIDLNLVYRDFKAASKKAHLTNLIRFHDIRHTFASQFVMSKGSIFDLQKILGHTDIKMTMRYSHFSMDHLHQAMTCISFGDYSQEIEQEAKIIQLNQ